MRNLKQYIKWILPVLAIAFSFGGCKPEDKDGKLVLNITATVNGAPLNFSSIFEDGQGKKFYVSALRYYLSHLQLLRNGAPVVEIASAAFVDHQDPSTLTLTLDAPPGDYDGLRLGYGLDAAQNATNPNDYPESSPLGPKEDMYWEWLRHRFVVLEGRADSISNTSQILNTGLTYHIGRDTCYRTENISVPVFSIAQGKNTNMTLELDLLKIFNTPGNELDMLQTPGTQSEDGDLPIAIHFMNNFSKAFLLK